MVRPPAPPKKADAGELSALCELSLNSIYKHLKKAGLTKDQDGRFDTRLALEAIARHQETDNKKAPGGTERERKARLEADILEERLKQIRGETIPRAMVEDAWTTMAAAMRARLLAIPSSAALQVAPETDPRTVEASLREYIDEALEELTTADLAEDRA